MKPIHELACVDADKAPGVSLLANGGLIGGDTELRQYLRRKQAIREWHRKDLGFSAHADAHFFADTKPEPQCPEDAVKASADNDGDDGRKQQRHDEVLAECSKVHIACASHTARADERPGQ